MADRLLEPHDGLCGAGGGVGGLGVVFGVAGAVVDGGGAKEDEGVDGAGDEREEVGVGDGVDVVEAEAGGDAE